MLDMIQNGITQQAEIGLGGNTQSAVQHAVTGAIHFRGMTSQVRVSRRRDETGLHCGVFRARPGSSTDGEPETELHSQGLDPLNDLGGAVDRKSVGWGQRAE